MCVDLAVDKRCSDPLTSMVFMLPAALVKLGLLTLLLVLTHGSGDADCPCAHRLAVLMELYNAAGGAAWLRPWDVTAPDAPCRFDGVVCNGEDIVALNLNSRGLRGSLPSNIGNLTGLMSFNVGNNTIGGSLPTSLRQMRLLVTFNVSTNQLTGTLPPELGEWTNVQEFLVSTNNMSGTLPAAYCGMTRILEFDVSFNGFVGTLPIEYSAWGSVIGVRFNNNNLSGTLPPEYSNMTMVGLFTVAINALTGTLPPEYEAWVQISSFYVNTNSLTGTLPPSYAAWAQLNRWLSFLNQLTRSLPPEYSLWTSITAFSAGNNAFTGPFPPQYCRWIDVHTMLIPSNALSGTIPSCVGGMMSLKSLGLSNNALSGTIPPTLSALPALQALGLSHNNLSGSLPLATSMLFVDVQYNTQLTGAMPSTVLFATVCGTGICQKTALPQLACLPVSAAEQLVDATFAEFLDMFAEHKYVCGAASTTAPPVVVVPIPSKPAPPRTIAGASALQAISAGVTYVALASGSGGTGRGVVPGLQRATGALRLSRLCDGGDDASSDDDPMFSELGDNPLGLSVDVGKASLAHAAGAALGNAALSAAIGVCLHAVFIAQSRLHRGAQQCDDVSAVALFRAVVGALPSSLLPGALAAAFGSLLQPSVGASTALVASADRSVSSVLCGVAMAAPWLAFASYCARRTLRCCTGAAFSLVSTAHMVPASQRRRFQAHKQRRHCIQDALHRAWAAVRECREHVTQPREGWTLRPRVGANGGGGALFLLEHMEAVFGAYVGRREWFFLVEWGTAAAGGVALGAAEAVAVSAGGGGDWSLCAAAQQWGSWCLLVISVAYVALVAWLRPYSVRLELWSALGVGAASVLAQVLAMADALDAGDAVANAASVCELVVMVVMMVEFNLRRAQRMLPELGQQLGKAAPRLTSIGPSEQRGERSPAAPVVSRNLCDAAPPTDGIDVKEQLRALVALACSRNDAALLTKGCM